MDVCSLVVVQRSSHKLGSAEFCRDPLQLSVLASEGRGAREIDREKPCCDLATAMLSNNFVTGRGTFSNENSWSSWAIRPRDPMEPEMCMLQVPSKQVREIWLQIEDKSVVLAVCRPSLPATKTYFPDGSKFVCVCKSENRRMRLLSVRATQKQCVLHMFLAVVESYTTSSREKSSTYFVIFWQCGRVKIEMKLNR